MTKKEATEKVLLIQPDGVAVSPLPDYPGQMRMPLVMTLSMHKRWQAFINGAAVRDPDEPRVGMAFTEVEDGGERFPFVYDDVRLGLMFGKLEVTGPHGAKLGSETPADDLPLPVAAWVARVYREWEDSQLLFRWDSRPGMAPSNSTEGH